MSRYYLDTSAVGKLLVSEPHSETFAAWLDAGDVEPCSTRLLETELRRLTHRFGLPQTAASAILEHIAIYELAPSTFLEAGLLPGRSLRSLDALHLAGALRLGVRAIVTYDARLAEAADAVGLAVLSPGA